MVKSFGFKFCIHANLVVAADVAVTQTAVDNVTITRYAAGSSCTTHAATEPEQFRVKAVAPGFYLGPISVAPIYIFSIGLRQ